MGYLGGDMPDHYLLTDMRSELEAVDLAWDTLLSFDDGATDRALIETIFGALRQLSDSWVLVGQQHIVDCLAKHGSAGLTFEKIATDGKGPLSETSVENLVQQARHGIAERKVHVFVCLTDRYDAHRLTSQLSPTASVQTFDVLKELLGERIPSSAWRRKFDHIYPIDLPGIEIQKGLDILLLDMPARSLAQLPIGFAYVYKAIRQTSVKLQAIDIDLVAYHRYHSRRCMNHIDRIESDGMLHPQDPWQAENYIVWTDKKFVDYFSDMLNEVVAKIVAARPKAVGFSLHQTSHVSVNRVVERLRELLPDVCIIVGGMSCYQHFVARRIFPLADYVVVGEADTVVGPLAEAIARGERPFDIPGVVSKRDTADRAFIGAPLPHNLDIVSGPDYGFTNLDYYVNWNGYRLMPLVGSRGCGWSRCTFCAERFNWRARTPENVAEEIEYYTTRGFKDFVFNESDFNSNLSFVVRLCKEIVRRGIKANFTAQLRVGKDCDFQYYKTMREAGFSCLRFGVDALSENTLLLQRKGYTKQMVMDNLKHCHDLGIYTEINVVVGVPGETEEDIEESADFIIQMKPYIGRVAFINPLMLFVGSVYYFEPERHKIKFIGDKEELYKQYFVSLPDTAWYSEEPYIDHAVRRQRFFRIVERIHDVGVPLGAFANFTAEFRKKHSEDSHTLTQPKAAESAESVASSAESLIEASPADASIAPQPAASKREEKTEFQKTFYGSWSAAFLSGDSWKGDVAGVAVPMQVVRLNGEFYLAKGAVVHKSEIVKFYPVPVLLCSYLGYNLVGYQDQILGAPHALGHIDLTQEKRRNDLRIIKGRSEQDVKSKIDYIVAAANMSDPIDQVPVVGNLKFFDAPSLLITYGKYNIVGYRDEILGAPLALGHVDLTHESSMTDIRILRGKSESEVKAQIDLIESGGNPALLAHAAVAPATPIPIPPKVRKVNMGAGVLLRSGK